MREPPTRVNYTHLGISMPLYRAPENINYGGFTVKKALSIILAAMLMTCCLSACSSDNKKPAPDSGKLQIVTTIFPEYD